MDGVEESTATPADTALGDTVIQSKNQDEAIVEKTTRLAISIYCSY
jgi:hypothetical protein